MSIDNAEFQTSQIEQPVPNTEKKQIALSDKIYGHGPCCELKQIIGPLETHKMSKQEMEDSKLFEALEFLPYAAIDQNRDGKITKMELKNYIKDMKVKQKEEGLSAMEKEGLKSAEVVLKNFRKVAGDSDNINPRSLNEELNRLVRELFPGFERWQVRGVQSGEAHKVRRQS